MTELRLTQRRKGAKARRGVTLLELLVVISIIALLSAIALPGLKGMRQSNIMNSANRQLLDDLALARQQAIKNRSEVCMVFAPPIAAQQGPTYNAEQLIRGQCTSYRIFAKHSVGDQPGRPSMRYITGWKDLPEGVLIAPWKFSQLAESLTITLSSTTNVVRPFKRDRFPHPSSTNFAQADMVDLGCLTFDAQGRLDRDRDASADGLCVIPLTRGAITYYRDATNGLVWQSAIIEERPPGNSTNESTYNFIIVDALTGRARVKRPEIQ